MRWLIWISTYLLIILAELGDKTQFATLLLASNNPARRWLIFGAGALALSACVLIEVTIGTTVARLLARDTINLITGCIFIITGLVTLYREYTTG